MFYEEFVRCIVDLRG